MFIGVSIGALSGYYRGWVEEVLMRITEFFQVLPTLLFSMVLVALFGASLAMVTFSIGIVELDGGGAGHALRSSCACARWSTSPPRVRQGPGISG